MNLIELFESKPFQDVGTFNSIFPNSPILGFDSALEVEIKEQTHCGRRIAVDGSYIFLDLQVYKTRRQRTKMTRRSKKTLVAQKTLSNVFKKLTPSEFMIYTALKELGEVSSQGQLARQINISRRGIGGIIPRLIKLGLVGKSEERIYFLDTQN